MDIEFPGKQGHQLSPSVGSLDLKRRSDRLSLACLEASLISATRTAASAALAAEHVSPNPFDGSLCVIGTGVIARTTIEWLLFRKWKFRKISLYDLDRKEAEHLSNWLRDQHNIQADIRDRLEDAVCEASLVLLTTTASEPYLADEKLFEHAPTVLHLSLRDICVNVILEAQNIVDDVDHCLKANTSLHLTEMASGNKDHVSG
jgi:ornithine cyclodeaminase